MGFKKRVKIGGQYWYYTTLGSYSHKASAQKHAREIRKQGDKARVVFLDGKWRVCKR